MSGSRMVREGILTSLAVNSLSVGAELFYRRLMSVADDFGRYTANPLLLRSACYPLRIDTVKSRDVSKWLEECCKVGLLTVYVVEGQPYTEILRFGQRMRTAVSKYPAPNGNSAAPTIDSIEPQSAATRGQASAISLSRREEEEEGLKQSFERFLSLYPKKVKKLDAEKAWKKLSPKQQGAALKALPSWPFDSKEDGRFIPHAASWLNGHRWEDEAPAAAPERKVKLGGFGSES